jgi:membrane-bound metal-dependent hydrolase YbcI (DUF457 family)
MFAIGHFALGYLSGKGSSKLLKTSLNIPLLLAISVLPDVDLFLQQFSMDFMHRGPLHSLVTFTVFMIPFFIVYRKRAIPYYAVLLSHSLIGDFFAGGVQLFWPISLDGFGNNLIGVGTLADVVSELSLFAAATPIMYWTGDLRSLTRPEKSNFALVVAFFAVLGPVSALGADWGASLPVALLAPSLFWMAVFAYSILSVFGLNLRRRGKG